MIFTSLVVRLSPRGLKIVIGAREKYTRLLGDLIRGKAAALKKFSQSEQELETLKRISGLLRLVKYIQVDLLPNNHHNFSGNVNHWKGKAFPYGYQQLRRHGQSSDPGIPCA